MNHLQQIDPNNSPNWEKLCQHILISYYQLAENYRNMANQNQQLRQLFKEKLSTSSPKTKISTHKPQKIIKKELPDENQQVTREKIDNLQKNSKSDESQNQRQNKKESKFLSNKYICTYPKCSRFYDSSVSLNLHIKLKHNGGTKKQRQTYAKIILDAEQKGTEPPNIGINFPPGFLQVIILLICKVIQKKLQLYKKVQYVIKNSNQEEETLNCR